MISNYHVEMNDGTRHNIMAQSAGDAVQQALEQSLGKTVAKCWSDFKAYQQGGVEGHIDYDIPRHVALKSLPPKPEKKKPEPCTLFDDAQVLKESAKALERAGL